MWGISCGEEAFCTRKRVRIARTNKSSRHRDTSIEVARGFEPLEFPFAAIDLIIHGTTVAKTRSRSEKAGLAKCGPDLSPLGLADRLERRVHDGPVNPAPKDQGLLHPVVPVQEGRGVEDSDERLRGLWRPAWAELAVCRQGRLHGTRRHSRRGKRRRFRLGAVRGPAFWLVAAARRFSRCRCDASCR